jgi:hypothetical protein
MKFWTPSLNDGTKLIRIMKEVQNLFISQYYFFGFKLFKLLVYWLDMEQEGGGI